MTAEVPRSTVDGYGSGLAVPTFITYELLEQHDICFEYRALFDRLFPLGVELTVDVCVQHATEFDWDWAADKFLTGKAGEIFETVVVDIWNAYDRAVATRPAQLNSIHGCNTELQRRELIQRMQSQREARLFAELALGLPVTPIDNPLPNVAAAAPLSREINNSDNDNEIIDNVQRLIDALARPTSVFRTASSARNFEVLRRSAMTRRRNAAHEIDALIRAYLTANGRTS